MYRKRGGEHIPGAVADLELQRNLFRRNLFRRNLFRDGLDGQAASQQVSIRRIGPLGTDDQRRVVNASRQVRGFHLGATQFARGPGSAIRTRSFGKQWGGSGIRPSDRISRASTKPPPTISITASPGNSRPRAGIHREAGLRLPVKRAQGHQRPALTPAMGCSRLSVSVSIRCVGREMGTGDGRQSGDSGID